MRTCLIIFLIVLGACVHAASGRGSIIDLVSNYVKLSGESDEATLFISDTVEAEFYWVYWAEMRMLFAVPKEFRDEAVSAPSLVIRKPLVFPDDVREKGNKEMETSTYLVSFEWFRTKLTDVVTSGSILHLKTSGHKDSTNTNVDPGSCGTLPVLSDRSSEV